VFSVKYSRHWDILALASSLTDILGFHNLGSWTIFWIGEDRVDIRKSGCPILEFMAEVQEAMEVEKEGMEEVVVAQEGMEEVVVAQEGMEEVEVVKEAMEVEVPTVLATVPATAAPLATALVSGEELMLSSLLFPPVSQDLLVHHHSTLGHLQPGHLQGLHSHLRSQHSS